jgi:hypothetical protein
MAFADHRTSFRFVNKREVVQTAVCAPIWCCPVEDVRRPLMLNDTIWMEDFMDDFLYNLRRESDKRNRRQSGQQQYRGPDRRGMKDQRRGYPRRNEAMEQLSEVLPEIKSLLETVAENQKKFAENEKRKTLVLENIAASLRLMSGNTQPVEAVVDEVAPVEETVAAIEQTDNSEDEPDEASHEAADAEDAEENPPRSKREDVRKIALELRDQGKTYKEIAQYLDDKQIPTFSGKGGWHAPTIHKLCK